ncbi:MAG: COG2363 [uncultured Thiotrichaceae bacterium]|uniref:COG2363 n=1 Tax=uncultured Thiotrichaceae bacterium TaxID=298394 RepID=A0A6S6TI48_9GAMM|nr:MAG: COG2363 [uncultured Thiotrichaceae bacterium]
MNYPKFFLVSGAFFGFLSVALGAFGAHGLEKILTEKLLETFKTAVEYQSLHSIVLLIIGLLASQPLKTSAIKLAGSCFIIGILLFSGSLYLYIATQTTLFAMITPVGGIFFLFGWLALIVAALKHAPPQDRQQIDK